MQWTVAIGIDTHKCTHVAVALDRRGGQLDSFEAPATSAGYLALHRWAHELGEPVFALEGAGSYGAGLARFLQAAGCLVYECERPKRVERRRGKNDLIDALLAARRLLTGERLGAPRGLSGPREDLRLLLLERRSAIRARTATLNQLQAVLVTAPERLRSRLGGRNSEQLARAVAGLRPRQAEQAVVRGVLRRLGRRVLNLDVELAELEGELEAIVSALVPELLAECGVGPLCAAQLVVSSGDPSRMASEASFAALAGTSPVEASSGQQKRHRLNRGGDRQLNRTLHVIALSRSRYHSQTAAYYQRLLASGKTTREARRCVKRMLARHFHHKLSSLPALALTT
ncbi:MAG: IS110 family transposase [Actinomycetota bacterium]